MAANFIVAGGMGGAPKQPLDIVKACFSAWSAGDVAGTLANIDDACCYQIHIPTDVLSFAGLHVGKAAIATCFQEIRKEFYFLAYALDNARQENDVVRARVVFYYQHRLSGQMLEGSCRHVTRVANERIVRIDEYHDVEMMRAFVEMARSQRED